MDAGLAMTKEIGIPRGGLQRGSTPSTVLKRKSFRFLKTVIALSVDSIIDHDMTLSIMLSGKDYDMTWTMIYETHIPSLVAALIIRVSVSISAVSRPFLQQITLHDDTVQCSTRLC